MKRKEKKERQSIRGSFFFSHHAYGKEARQSGDDRNHYPGVRGPAGSRDGAGLLGLLEHRRMPAAVFAAAGRRHARVVRLLTESLVGEDPVVGESRGRRRDERRVRAGRLLLLLLLLGVTVGVVVLARWWCCCCSCSDDVVQGWEGCGRRVGGGDGGEDAEEEQRGENRSGGGC